MTLDRRTRGLVIAILAASHLVVLGFLYVPDWRFGGAPSYWIIAHHLVEKGLYSLDGVTATAYRSPLYTVFLAATIAIFGEGYRYAAPVAQLLLSVGTGALLAGTCARILKSPGAAVIAAVLYAAHLLLVIELLGQREAVLFSFLVVSTGAVLARRGDSPATWALVGLLCGLSYLTRPTGIMLIAGVTFYLAIRVTRRGSYSLRAAAAAASIVWVTALLVASPWLMYTWTSFGRIFPSTTCVYGTQIHKGNNALISPSIYPWVDLDLLSPIMDIRSIGGEEGEVAREDRYLRLGLDYVRGHPAKTVKMSVIKIAALYSPIPTPLGYGKLRERDGEVEVVGYRPRSIASRLLAGSYMTLLYAGVLGYLLTRSGRRETDMAPFEALATALFIALTALHAISFGETRYRLPLDPLLIALATPFFESRLRLFSGRGSRR